MTIGVVVNPAAGGGRLGRIWPSLAAKLTHRLGPVEVLTTTRTGEGAGLAERLARGGATLVIAAGGDGTASEVADGLLRAAAGTELGILSIGTGRDFVRTLGTTRELGTALSAIVEGQTRQIDAGRVTYTGDDGRAGVRHFVNVASLGLSGPTVRAVNASKAHSPLPGKLMFYLHTVTELLKYRRQQVRVAFDDGEVIDVTTALVAVCNGRYFGGGMMIAPEASLDDGLFDVLVYRAEGKLRMILDFNLIYRGAHVSLPRVRLKQSRWVEVTPLGDPLANAAILDIDGESPGRIAARFEILPRALTLRG